MSDNIFVPRQVKWSNFHITVNYNGARGVNVRNLSGAITDMVEDDNLWLWLRHYDGQHQEEFDADTSQQVLRVRLRAALEEGGAKNHGLHAHILVEVMHDTMVQVSRDGLYEYFKAALGSGANIHTRFVMGRGEDKDFILQYLSKEIPGYRPQSNANAALARAFADGEMASAEYQQ